MKEIINVKNLKKSYGTIKAVKGIDFYVEKGKLFAFLGPNGAGKSTTIDIICTFLKHDAGMVTVDGHTLGKSDDEIRSIIGAVFQDGLLDRLLTVEENLYFRGSFYGLKGNQLKNAVKKAAAAANVTDLLKRKYGELSGGQRRRCDIARALINTPKILFLDEPTTGLDPQNRKYVWETIINLQQKTEMTVFFTTHYMEEAQKADYVIIIDNGSIAAKGTPAFLRENYSKNKLIITSDKIDSICNEINNLDYKIISDKIVININSTIDAIPLIEKYKDLINSFEVIKGTMDDAFIEITGKELRE